MTRQQSALCRPIARCQAPSVPTQKRVRKHPRHHAYEPRLIGQRRAQGIGQAQHPLPERLRWHDVRKKFCVVWFMRRPRHVGQKPRPAQVKATDEAGRNLRTQVREASLHHAAVEESRKLRSHELRQSGSATLLRWPHRTSPGFPAPPMQRLGKGVVPFVHPWPPPGFGGDRGRLAMRAGCHGPSLSVSRPSPGCLCRRRSVARSLALARRRSTQARHALPDGARSTPRLGCACTWTRRWAKPRPVGDGDIASVTDDPKAPMMTGTPSTLVSFCMAFVATRALNLIVFIYDL